MPPRNHKPGYRYGLIINQEKYPVRVHRPQTGSHLVLQAACGAGLHQGGHYLDTEDRRSYIVVQTRLLDGTATVYCQNCWKKGT